MRIAFRVDSSVQIGTGHVMRCLALAEALDARGTDSVFLCRELAGAATAEIERAGRRLHSLGPPARSRSANAEADDARLSRDALATLAAGPDWIVVDHYGLGATWEAAMRAVTPRILAIDDLADRRHDCDLLLDQSRMPVDPSPYDRLVPKHCRQLVGPHHALLRGEFVRLRDASLARRRGRTSGSRRVLVFMGGADEHDVTTMVLAGLSRAATGDIAVDVVAGGSNPHVAGLRERCAAEPAFTLREHVGTMAELMAAADVAVGAGGIASWERCCLGLPTVLITVAENQEVVARGLQEAGAASWLGRRETVAATDVAAAVDELLSDHAAASAMSEAAAALVDGRGAERTAALLAAEDGDGDAR
jgi:UDP-2,4-diacetamido-2,4,6-trideoxy-beta-L-altropyranose hydrolase